MTRIFSLLRIAAQAEGLRWRRTGRAVAIRAGLGAGALVFKLDIFLKRSLFKISHCSNFNGLLVFLQPAIHGV